MFQHNRAEFDTSASRSATSLAEILGAFSYALDLTEGQPEGHCIRASWIGTKLAQHIGLDQQQVWNVYYAVLLKDLGCSSNAARVAEMFVGDDRLLKHNFKLIGPDAADFGAFIMNEVGVNASSGERKAAVDNLLANAGEIMTGIMETRCTRGADIARQLRFSEGVAEAITYLDEHWDGSGLPYGKSGDAIPVASRIAQLSQIVDVFFSVDGPEAACAEVAKRRGSWLDPALVDDFLELSQSGGFWTSLGSWKIEQELFALEPAAHRVVVDDDYLDDIATAFGQVIDAKSPWTGGHSERVSLFADLIAQQLGFREDARRILRRAAMLHDVGKLGVSNRILDKPGRLDPEEWTAMQSHASLTTNILSRIGVMRDMAMIAGSHHERLDGRGYPIGLTAPLICMETRIITTADFFDALTADRPYRGAMSVERALEVMEAEVGRGVDPGCFAALKTIVARGIPQKPLPKIGQEFRL
jgi:putative nucleotidyltransferase with HDIG domain